MKPDKLYVELPPFTGRNVPIAEIARAMHKDAQYVRVGLQRGIFHFGYAIKLEDSNEYNYYCPDRKVWEDNGKRLGILKKSCLRSTTALPRLQLKHTI